MMCVCVYVVRVHMWVCVYAHICVCVFDVQLFFHALQHEGCLYKEAVCVRERERECVYSLCDTLTATKRSLL